jgi:UDP-glucose 4-epimerase
MRALITGAAGFIGSNLTDTLLSAGHAVVGYDNLSTGKLRFLDDASTYPGFTLIRADLADRQILTEAMAGVDIVFHLAANADVRFGTSHPGKDLEQNVIATWNVLEAMRSTGTQRIAFSSTGSVYGDPAVFPTPEDAPFPIQTSLYGASKLAAEGLLQAYSEAFQIQSYIFRFVSILGERYSHGHVFDFYQQLKQHSDRLHVLGNGKQRKSYLYVGDCIDAVLTAIARADSRVNIFNLGTDEYCEVNDSISWICDTLKVNPSISYAGGDRGWVGDSPFIFLDCRRMRALGWRPALTIREAVVRTVSYLGDNEWLFHTESANRLS